MKLRAVKRRTLAHFDACGAIDFIVTSGSVQIAKRLYRRDPDLFVEQLNARHEQFMAHPDTFVDAMRRKMRHRPATRASLGAVLKELRRA